MPRPAGRAARDLLARRKDAANRLRREVLGADGSLGHPYFRALERRLAQERPRRVPLDRIFRKCLAARLVYVGDFHAVPACQEFAADLLARLRAAGPVALGVEFVYARQQGVLDRRQSGGMDDASFLRRIHYREEWGYPWRGYGELLDRARELAVPVVALDSPPRAGFEGLARRDEHVARRIAARVSSSTGERLLVLIGESHLAPGHLPASVGRRLSRLGSGVAAVTIFQSPDAPYWRLLAARDEPPEAAALGAGAFAVFHTPPIAKYEAYRQVLERWREDVPPDEEVDLTPAVHHLVGVLLGWLGIDPERHRIRHRGGWAENLADAFPEVYSGPEAKALLGPILAEHGSSAAESREARSALEARGALYEPRSNTVFLLRYLPGRAAGEGARFLRAALSGRLFSAAEEPAAGPVERAYAAVYEEGLAYLGSLLVDPAGDYLLPDDRRALAAAGGRSAPRRGTASSLRDRWIAAHLRFEAGGSWTVPEEIAGHLRGARGVRRALARDLGHRLGWSLFERVRSGDLGERELRSLFSRPLACARAPRAVVGLLRGDRGP